MVEPIYVFPRQPTMAEPIHLEEWLKDNIGVSDNPLARVHLDDIVRRSEGRYSFIQTANALRRMFPGIQGEKARSNRDDQIRYTRAFIGLHWKKQKLSNGRCPTYTHYTEMLKSNGEVPKSKSTDEAEKSKSDHIIYRDVPCHKSLPASTDTTVLGDNDRAYPVTLCTVPRKTRIAGLGLQRNNEKQHYSKEPTETKACEENKKNNILVAPEPVSKDKDWDTTSFIEAQQLTTSGADTEASLGLVNGHSDGIDCDNDRQTKKAKVVMIYKKPVSDIPDSLDKSELANEHSDSIDCDNDRQTKKATVVAINKQPVTDIPDLIMEVDVVNDHMYAKHDDETTDTPEPTVVAIEEEPVSDIPDLMMDIDVDHMYAKRDDETNEATVKKEPVLSDITDRMVERDHMYAKPDREPTGTEGGAGEYIGYNTVKVEPGSPREIARDEHAYSAQQESQCNTNEWENDDMHVNSSLTKRSFLPIDGTRKPGWGVCISVSTDSKAEKFERIGFRDVDYGSLKGKTSSLSLLSGAHSRGFLLMQTGKEIQLVQHYKTQTPSVKLSVCIDEYFSCGIFVHRQPVHRLHYIWKGLPGKFDEVSSVMKLLDRINKQSVCCGNNINTACHELISVGEVLTDDSDIDVAYREGDFGAMMPNGKLYQTTIRSTQCSLLTARQFKCIKCTALRLNQLQARKTKNKPFLGTHLKHKDMTRDELYMKLAEQRAEIISLQSNLAKDMTRDELYEKQREEIKSLHGQLAIFTSRLRQQEGIPDITSQLAQFNSKCEKEDARLRQQQAFPDITGSSCNGDASMAVPESSNGPLLSKSAPSLQKPFTIAARSLEKPGMIGGIASPRPLQPKICRKPLHCEQCGRVLMNTCSFNKHMAMHRATKNMFICKKCGQPFKHRPSLVTHIRTVHNGRKQPTLKCSVCGKQCYHPAMLKAHKRLHMYILPVPVGGNPKISFNMDVAKAGWLFRQSTVMHRWKKYWFVLNQSGELRYFDGPDSHSPVDDKLVLRAIVTDLKVGDMCDYSPPEGKGKHCLIHLKLRDMSDLRLCAEDPDDMKAWQMAFEDARILPAAPIAPMVPGTQVFYPNAVPGGYSYPGQVIAQPGQYVVHNAAGGASHQTVVMANTPATQVVYMDEPRHYHRRRCYRGGPMFYGPLWW